MWAMTLNDLKLLFFLFKVYMLDGIARWNSDREAQAVIGQKGRNFRIYSKPLMYQVCHDHKELFGEDLEPNFRCNMMPKHDERIGLEYLFSQSTNGEFDETTRCDHYVRTVENLGKNIC